MLKKDDGPVAVTQTLTAEDYAAALAAVRYFAAPMRRRTVCMAACVTVAALAASFLPAFRENPAAFRVFAAVSIFFAAAAVAVWFVQPAAERHGAKRWFRSCPLAALPSNVTVWRDHAVVESKCERITEYWTDFSVCVETGKLIAAAGGRERFLFVVKKDGLTAEEAGRLSGLFRYAFEGRWYRMRGKGGK